MLEFTGSIPQDAWGLAHTGSCCRLDLSFERKAERVGVVGSEREADCVFLFTIHFDKTIAFQHTSFCSNLVLRFRSLSSLASPLQNSSLISTTQAP